MSKSALKRLGLTREQAIAEYVLSPTVGAANVIKATSSESELDYIETVHNLKGSIARIEKGDYSGLDAMLFSQAKSLDAIFNSLAATSISAPMPYKKDYFVMALKAQNQSRATIATLIKSKQEPTKTTFIKQANIANGNQQVNNGLISPEKNSEKISTHFSEQNTQSKLLEGQTHGATHLDKRAKRTAKASNQEVETVGEINGGKDS